MFKLKQRSLDPPNILNHQRKEQHLRDNIMKEILGRSSYILTKLSKLNYYFLNNVMKIAMIYYPSKSRVWSKWKPTQTNRLPLFLLTSSCSIINPPSNSRTRFWFLSLQQQQYKVLKLKRGNWHQIIILN